MQELRKSNVKLALMGPPGSAGRGIAALQSLSYDKIGSRRYDVGDTLSVKGARPVSDRPRHGGESLGTGRSYLPSGQCRG